MSNSSCGSNDVAPMKFKPEMLQRAIRLAHAPKISPGSTLWVNTGKPRCGSRQALPVAVLRGQSIKTDPDVGRQIPAFSATALDGRRQPSRSWVRKEPCSFRLGE